MDSVENTMEGRKWEDLNRDCLVEILARVGTETVAKSIPFVCKSWYDASLDPRCWKSIVFPDCKFWVWDDFIKVVVDRSQRSATSVVFPVPGVAAVSIDAFLPVVEGCPALKVLHLPPETFHVDTFRVVSVLIGHMGKLKNLECLRIIESTISVREILESINFHCKNFHELHYIGGSRIGYEDALSIIHSTPKIKHLTLSGCQLLRSELVMILKGCTELEVLDVSDCNGFEADDVEILNLASHIGSFICSGSRVAPEDYYDSSEDYYRHYSSDSEPEEERFDHLSNFFRFDRNYSSD